MVRTFARPRISEILKAVGRDGGEGSPELHRDNGNIGRHDLITSRGTALCRHLHIPLQSGDDKILSAMGRNYDVAFFRNRVYEIKEAMSDIAIGIDVMAGVPGEGEMEFENTVNLIAGLPAAYLHVFPLVNCMLRVSRIILWMAGCTGG